MRPRVHYVCSCWENMCTPRLPTRARYTILRIFVCNVAPIPVVHPWFCLAEPNLQNNVCPAALLAKFPCVWHHVYNALHVLCPFCHLSLIDVDFSFGWNSTYCPMPDWTLSYNILLTQSDNIFKTGICCKHQKGPSMLHLLVQKGLATYDHQNEKLRPLLSTSLPPKTWENSPQKSLLATLE